MAEKCTKCEVHIHVEKEVENTKLRLDKHSTRMDEICERIVLLEVAGAKRTGQIGNNTDAIKDLAVAIDKWVSFGQTFFWKITGLIAALITSLMGAIIYLIKLIIKMSGGIS